MSAQLYQSVRRHITKHCIILSLTCLTLYS